MHNRQSHRISGPIGEQLKIFCNAQKCDRVIQGKRSVKTVCQQTR